jgi:hypothetical protein
MSSPLLLIYYSPIQEFIERFEKLMGEVMRSFEDVVFGNYEIILRWFDVALDTICNILCHELKIRTRGWIDSYIQEMKQRREIRQSY